MKRMYVGVLLAGVLALCLTGGAVAASQITGSNIKNGSVTGQDIRNGSLSSADIRNGSVRESDLTAALRQRLHTTVSGSPEAPDQQGPKGDTGPQGPKGDTGPRGPAGPPTLLPADFSFTNTSARLTVAGVQFGRYIDGGATGGSIRYDGLLGHPLSDVTKLAYTFKYRTSDGSSAGSPYLRIFLGDDNHDVVLEPTKCATATVPQNTSITLDMTAATTDWLRYDDDACTPNVKKTWDQIVAEHGSEIISGIVVTTGFAGGHNAMATLTNLTVNDKSFDFGL